MFKKFKSKIKSTYELISLRYLTFNITSILKLYSRIYELCNSVEEKVTGNIKY